MNPAKKIWLNGKISSLDKAVSFSFHQGLNYGACVYDGIRFYNTAKGPMIFRLDEHIGRFIYSSSVLRMNLGANKKELIKAVKDTIKANRLSSGYVRPMAYYSEPKMGINILGADLTTVTYVWPWRDVIKEKRVTMKIVKKRRLDGDTVDLNAKISGYYANGLLGFIEARESGFDEPLFLDKNGYIAEGAVNNIFIVKGKCLYTPKSGNILGGITRDTIIKIAPDLGLKVCEKNIKPEFLRTADEIFLTGTGIELERVVKISGYFSLRKDRGSVVPMLEDHYRKIVHGEIKKYKKWLTPVR
jgi:branched-chain amino acid aminotransferase